MAFVVSSGSLMSVEKAVATAPVASVAIGQQNRAYEALWRAQPELRTVIDFIARNIAQLPLHVFERVSDVDRRRLTDHPLAELLARPNLSTTRYRLIDSLIHDLCIYDNAYWLKVRGDGTQPRVIQRIPPTRVTPGGSDWIEAAEYTIRGTRGSLTVESTDVVHFRGYNAVDQRVGTSPIESLRNILAEEWAANSYREQLWRNGARISGYLKRPVDAPEWGKDARRRFRDEWRAQWTGDGPQAGGTPILEDGMDFVSAAVSPRDAEYVASRKLTREEVARSYHVPLPMVGILDHATFSNIREQHKQLYQDCLGPWLEQIQEEIELQLLPDLIDPAQANVYVEFTIAEKLRGSFEEQAAQLQVSVGGPYMTRNEARARLNLPQIDGGDDLIVPLNLGVGAGNAPSPGEQDSGDGGAANRSTPVKRTPTRVKARVTDNDIDRARKTLAGFFDRQARVVLSALGAKSRRAAVKADASDVFDQKRWDDELAADMLRLNTLVATSAAKQTMAQLGLNPADFDTSIMSGWLTEHATATAKAINITTFNALAQAIADGEEDEESDAPTEVKGLFDTFVASRAAMLAVTIGSALSGFGSTEAGKQAGGPGTTKTWVTGDNPRPSHASMDNETVDIDDVFSNGARWPADTSALDAEDIAGCNCAVIITVP